MLRLGDMRRKSSGRRGRTKSPRPIERGQLHERTPFMPSNPLQRVAESLKGVPRMTTVLIVDDHPMVARYTNIEVVALRPSADVRTAGSIGDADEIIRGGFHPDYVLLDLMLPDCEGLSGLVHLRKIAPNAVIGVVSGETDPRVMRDCFTQGARGYLTKSTGADDFTDALRKLFDNGFHYPPQAADPLPARSAHRLTQREVEVLQALALGKLNKQLAPLLQISESTFKTYLRSIYDKLGVGTRVEAVRRGEELGLVTNRRRT
jgi:DNA-binding NarL/FixJ family response regulator